MKLRGSLLVIVCCLLVEFCNLLQQDYEFLGMHLNVRVVVLATQGISFLLYPFVGHLTEVHLTRYRSLKWSFGILLFALCATIVYIGIDLAASNIWKIVIFHHKQTGFLWIIIYIVFVIGLGLFQANAIQFGLDQLLEAPTPKLIAFIHWYYWAQNVGSLIMFYATSSGFILTEEIDLIANATISRSLSKSVSTTVIFMSLIITTIIILTTIVIRFYTAKKYLYIQKAGLNPFKNIYKVLKYSWKHKVPEHRSAFQTLHIYSIFHLLVSTCIFIFSSCMYLYLLKIFHVSTSTQCFYKSSTFPKKFF